MAQGQCAEAGVPAFSTVGGGGGAATWPGRLGGCGGGEPDEQPPYPVPFPRTPLAFPFWGQKSRVLPFSSSGTPPGSTEPLGIRRCQQG